MDYSKIYENIVQGTCDYLVTNHLQAMVLGISGGLDSTVTAAICHTVSQRTGIPLYGISLPSSSNQNEELWSAICCATDFCDHFRELTIQTTFEAVERLCEKTLGVPMTPSTPISQGNIKARLRMITLYDMASKLNGIVMDTDNMTEMHLGFFTIHGDTCDFNPIGGLWKTEVYGLAKWMLDNVYPWSAALKKAIEIVPTDGNGVKEGGDLAQIAPGATYDDVDGILKVLIGLPRDVLKHFIDGNVCEPIDALVQKYGAETVLSVCKRTYYSAFKRRHAPLVVNILNGSITDKSGNPIV